MWILQRTIANNLKIFFNQAFEHVRFFSFKIRGYNYFSQNLPKEIKGRGGFKVARPPFCNCLRFKSVLFWSRNNILHALGRRSSTGSMLAAGSRRLTVCANVTL